MQDLGKSRKGHQKRINKLHSLSIILTIIIAIIQWSERKFLKEENLEYLSFEGVSEGRQAIAEVTRESASESQVVVTATLLCLSTPLFFPFCCHLLFKVLSWPFDILCFSGKCTFKLAYPSPLSAYVQRERKLTLDFIKVLIPTEEQPQTNKASEEMLALFDELTYFSSLLAFCKEN